MVNINGIENHLTAKPKKSAIAPKNSVAVAKMAIRKGKGKPKYLTTSEYAKLMVEENYTNKKSKRSLVLVPQLLFAGKGNTWLNYPVILLKTLMRSPLTNNGSNC